MAAATPRPADPRRAGLHPAVGDGRQGRPAEANDLLPVPRRPGQADPEGHRSADRESREGRRRSDRGETEPVRPAHRRQEDDQPDPRDQGPSVGRVEGLHHQSGGPDRRLRPGRLSPAVADREELSHVQERPPSPTDLPPQTRVDRSPPKHRDDRSRRSSPGRTGHRLEHRQVRQDPATPSPSRPASRSSPPPTPFPPTPSTHSPKFAPPTLRTNWRKSGPASDH